ncbi:uncharacterized protein LOC123267125 [Cotesia glomerata]|uniref:uncharacterized protein LOC123267125 n=1 Tax=Cotesia glomerata TaxID=32391 RepID=UPI001D025408|nr:uncharacterized protein LOC123267125 [Cotesia glomerata]
MISRYLLEDGSDEEATRESPEGSNNNEEASRESPESEKDTRDPPEGEEDTRDSPEGTEATRDSPDGGDDEAAYQYQNKAFREENTDNSQRDKRSDREAADDDGDGSPKDTYRQKFMINYIQKTISVDQKDILDDEEATEDNAMFDKCDLIEPWLKRLNIESGSENQNNQTDLDSIIEKNLNSLDYNREGYSEILGVESRPVTPDIFPQVDDQFRYNSPGPSSSSS